MIFTSLRDEMIGARRFTALLCSKLPSEARQLDRRFEALRDRFFQAYWAAVAHDLGADIEAMGYGFYRLRKGDKATFVRRGEVMLDDHLTLDIAGNKPLVHRLLRERGCYVPDFLEYELREITRAFALMRRRGGNFVVKPANGAAGGRGITTKINTRARLIKASYKAAIHSSSGKLIIEREYLGHNYRLLYLDGEFLDAIQRESPGVIGDGVSSLRQLVRKENQLRLESAAEPRSLSPLVLDLDARYTLADQGLGFDYVPGPGERVRVKTATNQYSRFENHSVKDEMHPSIVDYGRRLSAAIPVRLSGVDLMLTDHRAPLEASGCVVNEINTTPGLHHHALISDPATQVPVGTVIIAGILEHEGRGSR